MLVSDVEGWVAIWVGSFSKKSEYNAYMKETYHEDDDETPISPFAADMKYWYYDSDYVFGEWSKGKPKSVEKLINGWRAADSFLEAAVAAAKKKKITEGNTIIVAYDHQYSSNRWPKDSPVRFLGNFPYSDKPPAPKHEGHAEEVGALIYSPDGKHVISGGDDGRIGVWNTKTGHAVVKPRMAFDTKFDDVEYLAFSQDGRRLVASVVNKTCVWDPFPDATECTKPTEFAVQSISPDGKLGLYCAFDKVQVYDLNAGKPAKDLTKKMPAETAKALPNGELVTVTPKKLYLWDFAKAKQLAELKAPFEQGDTLEISPKGKYAVTCDGENVAVWDLTARKLQVQFEIEGYIDEIVVPNEESCCLLLSNGNLLAYSLKKGTQTKHLKPAASRYFLMQASAKGDLVGVKEGKRLVVWDFKSGELLGHLPPGASPDDGQVKSFAFSPQGDQVAVGHMDGQVAIYNRSGSDFNRISAT